MKATNKHRGISLDSLLREEGIHEELSAMVAKEAIAWQLQQAMKKKKMTKVRMAAVMKTSRAQIDRLLDGTSGNVTIETLHKAARAVGRELKVELV
jgi:predicted XRE-type DNA-binding protein